MWGRSMRGLGAHDGAGIPRHPIVTPCTALATAPHWRDNGVVPTLRCTMNARYALTPLLTAALCAGATACRTHESGAGTATPEVSAATATAELGEGAAAPTPDGSGEGSGAAPAEGSGAAPAARAVRPGCPNTPRGVVLMIGDGMGPGQIEAGRAWVTGGTPLGFETWPHGGDVTTAAADRPVTDSAAAATAMATGHKVNYTVVSMAIPGDGQPLRTVAEWYRDCGRAIGSVTTSSIHHATPAAFFAHAPERFDYPALAAQILGPDGPDVVIGGGGEGISLSGISQHGYVATNSAEAWRGLVENAPDRVAVVFGNDHMPYVYDVPDVYPTLAEMSIAALDRLDRDPDGFFVMIEGSRIDHAGHDMLFEQLVLEMDGFSDAADAVAAWAEGRDDVLVVLTSDHETGGLHDIVGHGQGQMPEGTWSHGRHTDVNVIWRAFGPGADLMSGTIDNTDIFTIITGGAEP